MRAVDSVKCRPDGKKDSTVTYPHKKLYVSDLTCLEMNQRGLRSEDRADYCGTRRTSDVRVQLARSDVFRSPAATGSREHYAF